MAMKKMPAGKFRTRCLSIIEKVHVTREPVIVTKWGRPLVKVIPAEEVSQNFLGHLEGIVKILGDIESPIEPPEAWNALK